jgi:small subunit ribosomal protein S6
MTREYELVYIFDSALDEAQVNEHLSRFHALLTTPERPQPVSTVNHWGRRTLAFPLKRKDVGYYVVTRFEAAPEQLTEFERLIKLDESVLRHLVVLNEGYATVATPSTDRPSPNADAEDRSDRPNRPDRPDRPDRDQEDEE